MAPAHQRGQVGPGPAIGPVREPGCQDDAVGVVRARHRRPAVAIGLEHVGLQGLIAQPGGNGVGPQAPAAMAGRLARTRFGNAELARRGPGGRLGLRHQAQHVPLQQGPAGETEAPAGVFGGLFQSGAEVGAGTDPVAGPGLLGGSNQSHAGAAQAGQRSIASGRLALVQATLGESAAQGGGQAGGRRLQALLNPGHQSLPDRRAEVEGLDHGC